MGNKQYGYGPRTMNPAALNKRNSDLNPSGQNPDLITDLEAFYSGHDAASYADLIAIAPNMFDSYAGFVAAADDLVANYGTGVSTIASLLYAAGAPVEDATMDTYAVSTMTDAQVKDLLVALIAYRANVQNSWIQNGLSAYSSASPFTVATPHAASVLTAAGVTADATAINSWFQDLSVPGVGGLQITDLVP